MPRSYGRTFLAFAALVLASLTAGTTASGQAAPQTPRRSVGILLHGDESGVQVSSVLPGSPAEKAGVKEGDRVVSIAGIVVEELDPDKLRAVTDTAQVISLAVTRDGKPMTFQLTPAMLTPPANPQQPSGGNRPR
ncbi:MAG: PDZ domain-containing protein [Gemmatimonadetes bacterium]|nr:PDZ domain-containing protein [Gemmatimonadota bacterium]